MLIETEPTPNPATLKFLPGRTVMETGTRDFADPEAGEASPLAEALFDLGELLDHFSGQLPLFRPGSAGEIAIDDDILTDDPADADIVAQIKDLIETRVRPAVARDGGDIVYRGFDRGTVYLAMHGACSGCPSSTATLKQGIEQLLKHYVPEVTDVRAA
jgi:Fe-S cluster biogenesis protein NfuA